MESVKQDVVKPLSKSAAYSRLAELRTQLERVVEDMNRQATLFNGAVRKAPIGLIVQKQKDTLVYLRWKRQWEARGKAQYVMLDSQPVQDWLAVQEESVRRLYFKFARIVVYLNYLHANGRNEVKRLETYIEQIDAIPNA